MGTQLSEDVLSQIVHKHFATRVRERRRLGGGYSFETWQLTLTSGQKVVLRTAPDFTTKSGRAVFIAQVFERERFFYNAVNRQICPICPRVLEIDDTRELLDQAYQLSSFLEGVPLDQCFPLMGERERRKLLFDLGALTAKINHMEIGADHPFVAGRPPWADYIAGRLRERLLPLAGHQLVSQEEIDVIAQGMAGQEVAGGRAFLHMDLRFVNMIYNGEQVYLLDAENCEFGDPLYELAGLEMNGLLTPSFLEGYRSAFPQGLHWNNRLALYYQLERLALVLDLLLNEAEDREAAQRYLTQFRAVKARLLR